MSISFYLLLILTGFVVLVVILTFGMVQVAGGYDEASEKLYQKEIEKLEHNKKLMEEMYKNPEHIDRKYE
jgi:regulatory protein YycH of two-component signal transduction system YycFG